MDNLECCGFWCATGKRANDSFCSKRQSFIDGYRVAFGNDFSNEQELAIIGKRESKSGNTALIKTENSFLFDQNDISIPSLEELIIVLEGSQEL